MKQKELTKMAMMNGTYSLVSMSWCIQNTAIIYITLSVRGPTVYVRMILTYKVGPRTERGKRLLQIAEVVPVSKTW